MKKEYFQPHTEDLRNRKVGVIGYGSFGKLLHTRLIPGRVEDALIYDPRLTSRQLSPEKGARVVKAMEELVEEATIIFPAVPINTFPSVIRKIAPHTLEGSMVVDVCSVKEYPARVMKDELSDKTEIISTHPMFGPNSVASKNGDLTGMNFVIWNTRVNKETYDQAKDHFSSLGVNIIEMDPVEHDKKAAQSQFFAQTVRYLANQLDLKPAEKEKTKISSLFDSIGLMGSDTQIYLDMISYNRFCGDMVDSMATVLAELQKTPRKGTIFKVDQLQPYQQTSPTEFFAQTVRYMADTLSLQPTTIDTVSASSMFGSIDKIESDRSTLGEVISSDSTYRQMVVAMLDTLTSLGEAPRVNVSSSSAPKNEQPQSYL